VKWSRACPGLRTSPNSAAAAAKKRAGFSKRSPLPAHVLLSDRNLSAALAACEKELGQMDLVHIVGYEKPYFEGCAPSSTAVNPVNTFAFFFSAAPSEISTVPPRTLFSARFAPFSNRAIPCSSAPISKKSIEVQLLAYDDPAGVTAAFNLNVLARINRELGADFDLKQFAHEALWNVAERRIEMHLRSLQRQRVDIPGSGLRIRLEEGETSGRKVRTNILRPNPSKWRRAPASTAKHSGSTKRGLSPRICGLSNKT